MGALMPREAGPGRPNSAELPCLSALPEADFFQREADHRAGGLHRRAGLAVLGFCPSPQKCRLKTKREPRTGGP